MTEWDGEEATAVDELGAPLLQHRSSAYSPQHTTNNEAVNDNGENSGYKELRASHGMLDALQGALERKAAPVADSPLDCHIVAFLSTEAGARVQKKLRGISQHFENLKNHKAESDLRWPAIDMRKIAFNPYGAEEMARTMQIDMRASLIRDRPAYPASEYYDAIRREQYRAHAQTLLEKGVALAKKKSYSDAQGAYLEALSLDPENVDLNVALGANYFNLKDYATAKVYFEKALKLNGEHTNAQKYFKITQERISLRESNTVSERKDVVEISDDDGQLRDGWGKDSAWGSRSSSKEGNRESNVRGRNTNYFKERRDGSEVQRRGRRRSPSGIRSPSQGRRSQDSGRDSYRVDADFGYLHVRDGLRVPRSSLERSVGDDVQGGWPALHHHRSSSRLRTRDLSSSDDSYSSQAHRKKHKRHKHRRHDERRRRKEHIRNNRERSASLSPVGKQRGLFPPAPSPRMSPRSAHSWSASLSWDDRSPSFCSISDSPLSDHERRHKGHTLRKRRRSSSHKDEHKKRKHSRKH